MAKVVPFMSLSARRCLTAAGFSQAEIADKIRDPRFRKIAEEAGKNRGGYSSVPAELPIAAGQLPGLLGPAPESK